MLVQIGGDADDWGLIPGFLDERDPRPAKEQIAEKYLGGWLPLPGGQFDCTGRAQ
jgi:hypothetical protein